METNSQGRKKHLVSGNVADIEKGAEVVKEAVEKGVDAAEEKVEAAVGVGRKAARTKSKGLFARILGIFGKK